MNDKEKKIEQFRIIVQNAIDNDKESYDLEFYDSLKNKNWLIEKYLERKEMVEDAAQLCLNGLKFHRSFNLSKLTPKNFPSEYYKMSIIFNYGKDKFGNHLLFIRHQFYRKIKELDYIYKQFILYLVNEMDMKSNHNGMAIIVDLNNISFDNTDMDYARWGMNLFGNCCPPTLNYVLLYNLPKLMVTVMNLVKSWLPKDLAHVMKFCNGDEIFNYVDRENLPKFLNGGQCKINHYIVPDECQSIDELGPNMGLEKKSIDKIKKIWKPYLSKCENERKNYYG